MRPRLALLPVLVVVALGVCSACAVQEQERLYPPDDPRYCTIRYGIDGGRIPVCASAPLHQDALARLEAQLQEVRALYPRFASLCGVELKGMPEELALHVVRYEELNDRAAFPRDERTGNILGRYYVGRQTVFVTERALDDEGAIHLPHELAHWLHEHAGIQDPDEDERLARAFHRFYRSRTSARPTLLAALAVAKRYGEGEDLGLTSSEEESPPARDRSLAERTDGPGPPPLMDDLCGR